MSREFALFLIQLYCIAVPVVLIVYSLIEWQRGRDSNVRLWRD